MVRYARPVSGRRPPPTGGHSFRLPAGSNAVNLAFEGPLNPNLTNITAGSEFDLTAYGLVTNAIVSGFSGVQATFFSASGANLGTVQTSPGKPYSRTRLIPTTSRLALPAVPPPTALGFLWILAFSPRPPVQPIWTCLQSRWMWWRTTGLPVHGLMTLVWWLFLSRRR